MRISPVSFPAHLAKGLGPLYLIFGPEILLVEETLEMLRLKAREQGFTDVIRYTVEPGFDWNQMLEQGQTMSLFSQNKCIELRMPTGKPGDKGAKALADYAQNAPRDHILVVISGNIDKRGQGTKWFMALDSAGVITQCPPIPNDRLPEWIKQRMSGLGLTYNVDAVQRLCQLVEGNLLAASQEINLLSLLYRNEKITLDKVEKLIADHARFNVYALVDACLTGSSSRSVHILQSLKREGAEPVIILWALTREVRVMCQICASSEKSGRPIHGFFQRYGVWSSRQKMVQAAMHRLNRTQLEDTLVQLSRADLMAKGSAPKLRKDIWEEMESIVIKMCGLTVP